MNLLLVAAGAVVLALSGVGGLAICWPSVVRVPLLPRLALGYCVGTFVVAVTFFAAYLADIAFSRRVILTPIGLLAVVGVARAILRRPEGSGKHRLTNPAFGHRQAVFLGGLLIVSALALSWVRPVYGYDALSMWALKAKVAFFARTWPPTLFDPRTTHHTEYPPLVPSAQAFVYLWLNAFDDVASRVVFATFFAAGAAILWWLLGELRASNRGVWLLWWCALPLLMEQVKITYADLPLAVFLLVFFGAGVLWLREANQRAWLWLAALFGGMAFGVKQDALIGIGAGYAALMIVAWRRKLPLRLVGVAVAVTALVACPWPLFVWWKHLPGDFALPTTHIGEKLPVTLGELAKATFVDGSYAFFWTVFVLTLVFCRRRLARADNLWLALATAFGFVAVIVVFLSTTRDLVAVLKTSVDRVLLSVFVPALLLVALLWRCAVKLPKWRTAMPVGAILAAAVWAWLGLHRKSDEELFGISVSAFPVALSWVWLAVTVITLWEFLPRVRVARMAIAWRATQFAVVLATFGLALVEIAASASDWGECWRRFGGKTLAEKHAAALEPAVKEAIADAVHKFAEGAHVRVAPKRSIRYHQFYYETFPALVLDDSATNEVTLPSQ